MPGKHMKKSVMSYKKSGGFKMAGMSFGNEDPSVYAYKKAKDPRKAGVGRGTFMMKSAPLKNYKNPGDNKVFNMGNEASPSFKKYKKKK